MLKIATKAFLVFLTCTVASWSGAVTPKFQAGDCISPVDPTFTWYGKFARVDAVSRVDGFGGEKLYILAFPKSISNSVIFALEIEESVAKVTDSLCLPN